MGSRNQPRETLSIKQVAELYGMTIATLYYYEHIGLFSPQRNESNGYRYYSGEDFAHLSLIRTLHDMDVKLDEIKEYEQDHTLSRSISLLENELHAIDEEFARLHIRQNAVQSTLMRFAKTLARAPKEEIIDAKIPERPCFFVSDQVKDSENIPLLCVRALKTKGLAMNVFQMLPTFTVTTEPNEHGHFNGKRLMLLSELPIGSEDDAIPAGRYVSVTFRGSLQRTPEIYRRIVSYLDENDLEPLGDPVEFWDVNEYSSICEDDYIHTLQQRVRKT